MALGFVHNLNLSQNFFKKSKTLTYEDKNEFLNCQRNRKSVKYKQNWKKGIQIIKKRKHLKQKNKKVQLDIRESFKFEKKKKK